MSQNTTLYYMILIVLQSTFSILVHAFLEHHLEIGQDCLLRQAAAFAMESHILCR